MEPFTWRDMSGNKHNPCDMDTDYVFNVFRMIWNHRTPPQCHIWLPNDVKYHFPKRYTKNYMKRSFGEMYKQLKNRDLNPLQSGFIMIVEKWMKSIPNMLLNVDDVIWA